MGELLNGVLIVFVIVNVLVIGYSMGSLRWKRADIRMKKVVCEAYPNTTNLDKLNELEKEYKKLRIRMYVSFITLFVVVELGKRFPL